MPVVYIRLAVSHPGTVGQSGMEDTVMTCASFLKGDGRHGRYSDHTNYRIKRPVRSGSTAEISASVNFLTCHDGFTLYDLYSYNMKHNEKNGWG